MKKIFLFIVAAFLSAVSYAGGKIDIRLKNCDSPVVYITGQPYGMAAPRWQDSVVLEDGAAVFEMPQTGDYLVTLRPGIAAHTPFSILNIRTVQFYYFPGDELKIEADFGVGSYVPIRITGSEIYDAHVAFFPDAYEIYEREMQQTLTRLIALQMAHMPADDMADERALHSQLMGKINDVKIGYIREHPDSPLSGMYYIHISPEASGPLYEKLSDRVKNGKFKNIIDASYKAYRDQMSQ